MNCDYCTAPFESTRHGQRFCCATCRSSWHRENKLPGQVTGVRELKKGWAVTIRYQDRPAVHIGTYVRLETDG